MGTLLKAMLGRGGFGYRLLFVVLMLVLLTDAVAPWPWAGPAGRPIEYRTLLPQIWWSVVAASVGWRGLVRAGQWVAGGAGEAAARLPHVG